MKSRWTLLTLILCGPVVSEPGPASAQATKKNEQPSQPGKHRELTVSPSATSIPLFKYSLLPSSARLRPGNAAPILLRLRYDLTDEEQEELNDKTSRWMQLPLEEFPVEEVKTFVDGRKRQLDLLDIAAHRADCDWAYPIDEQRLDVIDITLSDAQTLRIWGRLLSVKARIELAEKEFGDAAKTLETGFAYGRQVGSGPFIINGIFGLAIVAMQIERVEEWIATPGSPNLYWSLTRLPQPVVSLRDALEQEQLVPENLIPELVDEHLPTTPEGWSRRLETIDARTRTFVNKVSFEKMADGSEMEDETRLKAALGPNLATYKRMHLPALRRLVVDSNTFNENQIQAMSEDEIVARGVILGYQKLWDQLAREIYPPFAEVLALKTEKTPILEDRDGPLVAFMLLYPSVYSVRLAEARLDRRIALLRTVEAIRLYAAAHDGALPAALDDVTEVPTPRDLATGRPFEYRLDGETAVLSAPGAPELHPPEYRVSIRKP